MSFRRSTIFYHKRFITSSSLIPLSSLIQRLSTKKASTFMVFSSQFPFTFPFHDVVQQQRRRRQRRRRRWQQWRTPRIESIYRSSNIHNGLEQRVTSRLHEGMFFSSLHLFLFFPFLPFSLFPFFIYFSYFFLFLPSASFVSLCRAFVERQFENALFNAARQQQASNRGEGARLCH